jgi:hypothetical protein
LILNGLFSFDALQFLFAHLLRIVVVTHFLDAFNAGVSIRFEDQSKDFGDEIVHLFAFLRGSYFFATGTRLDVGFTAANADFAPGGFYVFRTPRTFTGDIFTASSAI